MSSLGQSNNNYHTVGLLTFILLSSMKGLMAPPGVAPQELLGHLQRWTRTTSITKCLHYIPVDPYKIRDVILVLG